MTPCGKLGYKVGQVFEYTGEINRPPRNGNFSIGDTIILVGNIEDMSPDFLAANGRKKGDIDSANLRNVKRIYPPEEVSQEVEVTCEGKTKTISRKDAKALDLCD